MGRGEAWGPVPLAGAGGGPADFLLLPSICAQPGQRKWMVALETWGSRVAQQSHGWDTRTGHPGWDSGVRGRGLGHCWVGWGGSDCGSSLMWGPQPRGFGQGEDRGTLAAVDASEPKPEVGPGACTMACWGWGLWGGCERAQARLEQAGV